MDCDSTGGPTPDAELIVATSPVEPPAKRGLGFVAGGPIADSFNDALSDDELRHWEPA